ncbi:unnamed protein product [Cuscuta epithymum]|uniref:Uncharacterized protein n=1 Tax=Cuscuta epithymum TaxID=186058 RepID=A0AAV0BV73_9ASTE|nr:unnamed protein product [Cuscuta epithymum]
MSSSCKWSQFALTSINFRASTISCIDRRKSKNGSGDIVETATLPPTSASGSVGEEKEVEALEDDVDEESTMEFDLPGDEKKKRRDAWTAARSGAASSDKKSGSPSSSVVEEERAGKEFGLGEHSMVKS